MASGMDGEVDVNILSMTDIENSQRVFANLDLDNTGSIDKDDLETAFRDIGINCSKELIVKMINDIDSSNKNTIEYNDFLRLIAHYRATQNYNDENDFIDAFVAMGGNADMSGKVDADKLIEVIKEEFGMTIDIERLIKEIDEDGSGEIEYGEFKALLSGNTAAN